MQPSTPTRITATFIVRLWAEGGAAEAGDWRGQVEHLQSGDKRYFVDMANVLDFIAGHLGESEGQSTQPGDNTC